MPLLTVLGIVELILSFVGTGIAGTLFYAYVYRVDLPCSTGGGCALVDASHWSLLFGHPVAMYGALSYATLAVLSAAKLFSETPRAASIIRGLMLLITLIGVCFSWYLQYVAAVLIGAFCIWCRSSAIDMTVLFLIVLFEWSHVLRSPSLPKRPATEP